MFHVELFPCNRQNFQQYHSFLTATVFILSQPISMSDDELDEEMMEMLEIVEMGAGFNRELGLDDIEIPVIPLQNVIAISFLMNLRNLLERYLVAIDVSLRGFTFLLTNPL